MNQPPTAERAESSAVLETQERDNEDQPRIYVASLSDYNAGRLHGTWIEAAQRPEELERAIHHMLTKSKEPIAEEWAIHDYEGFGPLHLSEYESIEHVSALAHGISKYGRAFAHWAGYIGPSEWESLDEFEDNYLGRFSSTEELAGKFLDDLGFNIDSFVPEQWQPYVSFDLDAFARDLCFDFYVVDDSEGVYVFRTM